VAVIVRAAAAIAGFACAIGFLIVSPIPWAAGVLCGAVLAWWGLTSDGDR
jgi:hypothetical protein